MTQGGRAGDVLRRVIAPRLHWVPGLRDRLLDGETPALHRTSLVMRPRLGRSLAGRQCPNAPLVHRGRLDSALGTGFAVITTVPLTSTEQATITERGAVVIDASDSPELQRWLTEGGARAVVVRPDYTVACAAIDVATAIRALPVFHVSRG